MVPAGPGPREELPAEKIQDVASRSTGESRLAQGPFGASTIELFIELKRIDRGSYLPFGDSLLEVDHTHFLRSRDAKEAGLLAPNKARAY